MNKKEFRNLLILGSIILIGMIYLFYFKINLTIKENNMMDFTEQAKNCKVNIPSERIIILRMDDIGSKNRYELGKEITEEILKRNQSIVLGVIPNRLDNKETISWLKSLKDNPKVEIAQHGYEHINFEFNDLNKDEATNRLLNGKKIIFDKVRVNPLTFIPPNNKYSEGTINALKDLNYKVLSAEGYKPEFKEITSMGFTTQQYYFTSERFAPAKEVFENCKANLNKNNICIIVIHPQDYSLPNSEIIDSERYSELLKLLDSLKELNAEPKTFKNLIIC